MKLRGKDRVVRVAFVEEEDDDGDERMILIGLDEDGKETERIASDGGEPEDASFRRDWKWVRRTIQELLDEIERLRAGTHEVREELLSPTGSWEKVVGKAVGKIDAIEGEGER